MVNEFSPSTSPDARLRALAKSLGVPTEAFFVSTPPAELDETLALLRLWAEIGDSLGRRRVLDIARQEAERSGK